MSAPYQQMAKQKWGIFRSAPGVYEKHLLIKVNKILTNGCAERATTSKLVVEESVRETKREEAKTSDEKKKIVVTKMQPEIQHISRTYQSARSSFKGEYSSLRGKHNKEPWLKSDPRMSFFLKPKRGSYQKSIQVTSGETGGGTLESRSQMRQDESKQLQRTESMLKEMAKYCHCPDLEVVGEVEMSEMQVNFEEFRQSTENPTGKRSKIKSVTRSPFERKDRAARAAFAKELEQIEIAEIEKKQRLKPRKIKKELKTGGVYETVKSICQIPDSFTDSLRGHPSCPSAITGASPPISLGSNHTGTDGSQSKNSSEDKIQLRKETSMGSRTTPGRVTRDDAFHEIELSEDSETSYNKLSVGTPSASSCELISTSSDISLRVNLEESYSPNTKKRRKLINAPFVHYHNKANAEMILAEGRSKAKILDTNLEGVIIERIATEFGEWAKENGVKPEAVEKDVIKELFQFGTMDTAANSIAVEIKELIIVPDTITGGIYPELEERAAMYRQILFDECSYWRTERSMAFGKPDPKPYKRPQNAPLPAWTKSGFVPQPLATGEQLYQTLIDNDSTSVQDRYHFNRHSVYRL
ncbi:hypothetical protein GE061_007903 [Apolygus lucorum]|uniref:Uncharacterized protein n=1 Tax=Apolygus lucorum TaxID=248454 RepID=A0A8S9WQS5_APOLU|nr:hypothetical protein GE061_007903 [Apolygus lucorum]